VTPDMRRVGDRDEGMGVEEVAAEIAPLLRPDSMVMAFQNGLGAGERVARHIPPDHILIGIAEGSGRRSPSRDTCTTKACG
jgi:ketopantoate reductase